MAVGQGQHLPTSAALGLSLFVDLREHAVGSGGGLGKNLLAVGEQQPCPCAGTAAAHVLGEHEQLSRELLDL